MTEYEKNFQIVKNALEAYRDAPPDSGVRRFVDWLMKRSLKDAQNDPEGKKYHNLIVLRYISSTKRAKKPICDALHICRANRIIHKGVEINSFDAVTYNAIDRLLVLAFGFGGIDWDGPIPHSGILQRGALQSEAAEAPPESELAGQMAELTGLKYSLVAGLLAGMERHIKESAELSAEERGGILAAVKTAQARLVLNAVFDL